MSAQIAPSSGPAGHRVSVSAISKRRPGKAAQARRLPQSEAEGEHRLSSDLRNRRPNGYKFARQVPFGPHIVDLLCRDERLVIGIDGFQHAENGHDVGRTRRRNRNGYAVLRFWNHEITRERRAVLETILAALTDRLSRRCDSTRDYPPLITDTESTGERT